MTTEAEARGEKERDLTTQSYCFEGRKEPQAEECRRPLKAGEAREVDSALEPPEGVWLCPHLDFRALTSRTGDSESVLP